jgi:hypothetical protein
MNAPLRVPTRTRTLPLGCLTFALEFLLRLDLGEVVLSEVEGRRVFFLVFMGGHLFVVGDFFEVKEEIFSLAIGLIRIEMLSVHTVLFWDAAVFTAVLISSFLPRGLAVRDSLGALVHKYCRLTAG